MFLKSIKAYIQAGISNSRLNKTPPISPCLQERISPKATSRLSFKKQLVLIAIIISILLPVSSSNVLPETESAGVITKSAVMPRANASKRTSTPTFYRKAGSYEGQVLVRIKSSTKNAVIYYTTNGKTPTTKSTKYKGAFTLRKNTTVKAMAIKKGLNKSQIRTVKYKITANYLNRNGYLACSANEKKVYREIFNGITGFKTNIKISPLLNQNAVLRVYERISLDNPHFLQFSNKLLYEISANGIVGKVIINYPISKSKTQTMLKSLDEKADVIADTALKKSTVNARIQVINDLIWKKAKYDLSAPNRYIAYGVIVGGRGVCESFSRAFQFVCQKIGIKTILISGDGVDSSGVGPHMWNMVKSGGNWYHIDVTWNEPNPYTGKSEYGYYMISTSRISKDHIIYPIAGKNYGFGDYNYYSIPKATKSLKKPTKTAA